MDGADITLTQAPDPAHKALGKITVKGWMENSAILSNGNIGKVTVGGMRDASLFAGVKGNALVDDNEDGVRDLLNPNTDLWLDGANRATIESVTVKGIHAWEFTQKSVLNSNIAAAEIGSLSLFHPEYRLEPTFGVAADTITKCSVKFSDVREPQWTQKDLTDPGTKVKGHFEIRLA
jgi:hypothetical protein